MRIAGIDPGINGGIGLIDLRSGYVEAQDLPVMVDKALSWIDGLRLMEILRVMAPNRVIIERVSAMPKQGVSSSFHFGMAFGSILSVIQAAHLPFELVTPAAWKKGLGLPGNKDKKSALCRARAYYPSVNLSLQKHHNRAESLLIAHWYGLKYLGRDWTAAPPPSSPQGGESGAA